MEYKIIKRLTWETLVEDVNNLIKEGWIPQGGITSHGNLNYLQAMIKK